jgi:hypothetical protein
MGSRMKRAWWGGLWMGCLVGCASGPAHDAPGLPDTPLTPVDSADAGGLPASSAPPEPAPITTTVKLVLLNAPTTPSLFSELFVAYQDGARAWAPAPYPVGGAYTFAVASKSYGIAISCAGNDGETTLYELTTDDTREVQHYLDGACGAAPTPAGEVTGVLPPGSSAWLGWNAVPSTFPIGAPAGLVDVAVCDIAPGTGICATSIGFARSVAIKGGARTEVVIAPILPLVSAEAATVTGQAFANRQSGSQLQTANLTSITVGSSRAGSFKAVPTASRHPGDLYYQWASTSATGASIADSRRSALWTADPSASALELPEGMTGAVKRADAPNKSNVRFEFAPVSRAKLYTLEYREYGTNAECAGSQGCMSTRAWKIHLSKGWLGATSTFDYVLPDLSSVPGRASSFTTRVTAPDATDEWRVGYTDTTMTLARIDGIVRSPQTGVANGTRVWSAQLQRLMAPYGTGE